MNNHDTIDDRIDVVTRGTMALSVSLRGATTTSTIRFPRETTTPSTASSPVPSRPVSCLCSASTPTRPSSRSIGRSISHARRSWINFIRKQQAAVLKQHREQTAQYLLLSREPEKLAELIEGEFGLSDRKILLTGARRWIQALEEMNPESDPIFAPWFAFAALPAAEFADRAKVLSARIADHSLAHPLNSLVARAFAGEPPTSLKDVAERYGKLFEDADKQWQAMRSETNTNTNSNSARSASLPDHEQEALAPGVLRQGRPWQLAGRSHAVVVYHVGAHAVRAAQSTGRSTGRHSSRRLSASHVAGGQSAAEE